MIEGKNITVMAEAKRRKTVHLPQRRTRSRSEHYLVGYACDYICGSRLPTLREVMSYFLHLKDHCPQSTPTRELCNVVVHDVMTVWQMARIATILKGNAVKLLEKLNKKYIFLKATMKRESDPKGKRKKFTEDLDKLWDIGSTDAIAIIQNDIYLSHDRKLEDIAFYEDQQQSRKCIMLGRDKILAKDIEKKTATMADRTVKNIQHDSSDDYVVLASSSSSKEGDSLSSSSDYDADVGLGTSTAIKLMAPKNIMNNTHVSQALDRLQLTDNKATMLIGAFITACGGDIAMFSLSRSSTKRARETNRLEISKDISEKFAENKPQHVAIHWDGKLTEDRLGNRYEALSIVLSCHPQYSEGKLLGIQKMQNAAGQTQAETTFNIIESWNIKDAVTALVFDTTASNSGWKKGAAKILEDLLGRKVFYHACRHHVYELVVKDVWKSLFGKATTGPENAWFAHLKRNWSSLDREQQFKTLTIPLCFAERAAMIVDKFKLLLNRKDFFTRDDYKQCVTNALALLGADEDIRHHKPGAAHHARWMGTILYAQKMFMWADQLDYKSEEVELLRRFNLFLVLFYIPAWVDSSIGRDAAGNDLRFVQHMLSYKEYDEQVSTAASRKLLKHDWYIVEETAVYALFSPTESKETRENMAKALLQVERTSSFRRGPPSLNATIQINKDSTLSDLIGPQSWYIFEVFECSGDWLRQPVDDWHFSDSFNKMNCYVSSVKVVNDAAERGVKLSTDYAAILTDNEQQRDSLLQAVEQHRKIFGDSRKSTLIKGQ